MKVLYTMARNHCMIHTLWAIVISSRPRQWIKNGALFVSIVFGGQLFHPYRFQLTLIGFIVFCLISSSHYLLNDVIDARSDRKHVYKKFRPVAQRKLSEKTAVFVALVFLIVGLFVSLQLSSSFFLISFAFALFQYLYALVLKKVPVVDILTIVVGYVLRMYAGAIVSGVRVHSWLIVTAVMFSLFLAIGKRRAELTLIEQHQRIIPLEVKQRSKLYADKLLDTYMAMAATASFLTYTFFTFFAKLPVSGFISKEVVDSIIELPERKWLMGSIPFVLYGIMRYMQIVYEHHDGVLEKVLTSDKTIVITGFLWAVTVIVVIYGIGT